MAQLDPETSRLVIRLVYDGPAWAGKTTSLRSLASSLGSTVFSGEEADGRTLHFDWVDYVGGLFQGRPIQCQIVGVPGQSVLERRRLLLLQGADAVVFVADSRRSQAAENQRAFAVLRQVTAAAEPPVATVVQANKRDLDGALSLDELRELLGGGESLAMTEAVADRGEGIRETFVLAVRLALDRVRASLLEPGATSHAPEIRSGADLLREMLAREGVAPTIDPSLPSAAASDRRRGPRLPDASVEMGLVWPPVNGRVTIHEATRNVVRLERNADGDWHGEGRDWRLHSPVQALFFELEEGRQALIGWARWHTAAGRRLSPARALALAEAAPGAWRLWQIVRRTPSLRETCRDLVARADRAVGEGLFRIIDLRLRAEQDLVSNGWVPRLDLDSVGASEVGEPMLTGPAPFALEPPSGPIEPSLEPAADGRQSIDEELVAALRAELTLTPARLTGVLAGVQSAAEARERRQVGETIRRALLAC